MTNDLISVDDTTPPPRPRPQVTLAPSQRQREILEHFLAEFAARCADRHPAEHLEVAQEIIDEWQVPK